MEQTAKKTNNLRGQDICALILATALEQFSNKGYFNTSVQDIRRAADVSIGSIYHHFKGKEAIAKSLYDSLIEEMTCRIEGILLEYDSTHDRGRAVVSYLFDLAENSSEVMQYILYAKHQEFMPGEKPICSSRPFELLLHMIKQGIKHGELRDIDPVVATASMFGSTIRLIHLRLDGALQKPLPSLLDETWQCAWKAVGNE